MNHVPDYLLPTPEALAHSEIDYIKPARYERADMVPRRTGMHIRLADARIINAAQYEWCLRYITEIEILAGGREGKSEVERVDSWSREPALERPTLAAAFIRRTHDRLTHRQRELLLAALVMAYRIADVAMVVGLYPGDDETMEAFTNRIRPKIYRYAKVAIIAGSGISDNKTTT